MSKLRPADKQRIQNRILKKLEEGFSLIAAAKAGGIDRHTLCTWRNNEEAFDKACHEAIEGGTDQIEDVALGLAKKGNGIVCLALLNARRPEKFRRDNKNPEGERAPVSFTLQIGSNTIRASLAVPDAAGSDVQPEGQVRQPSTLLLRGGQY